MKLKQNVIVIVLWLGSVIGILTPVVNISQGSLRGVRSVSGQNRYYNIPYAVAKRFKPPSPPPKWEGILNAVYPFGSCAQTVSSLVFGSEDCLNLDVATPESTTPPDKLPVFVYIHGGGYYYGSKWHYDPEFLVAKNVIAVTVNFRLGVFGFLCVDGISNLGLKDQVAALKWIKKNIAAFGGDPDNVTVSGQSAGASSAAMHMLSKSSRGLFHKAILLSGTPLTPWAFNVDYEAPATRDALKIRELTSGESALDVFSTATVRELLNATRDVSIDPRHFKYAPCIDANFTEAFFHGAPYDAITSGNFNKVPIISGFTSVEGMLFYGLHDDKTLRELDEKFVEKLPAVFSWCPANGAMIAETLKSYYVGERINKASMRGIVNFYSDWMAYATADAFSNLMTRYSGEPVYNYIFSYEGSRNFARAIFGSKWKMKGTSHSDDIFYVFKPGGLPLPLAAPDSLFIDRLTTMLANFMKFGNPTPRKSSLLPVLWPPSTTNRSISMVLNKQLAVVETPDEYKGLFFKEMLCKYGQEGFVPCHSEMKCGMV